MSELKPSTKLDCEISPLCRFHDMEADTHEGLVNFVVDSITFRNSACKGLVPHCLIYDDAHDLGKRTITREENG